MATSEITNSLPQQILIGVRAFAATTHLFTPRLATRAIGLNAAGTPAIVYERMFGIRDPGRRVYYTSKASPRQELSSDSTC
jgi:hypothetical protein